MKQNVSPTGISSIPSKNDSNFIAQNTGMIDIGNPVFLDQLFAKASFHLYTEFVNEIW